LILDAPPAQVLAQEPSQPWKIWLEQEIKAREDDKQAGRNQNERPFPDTQGGMDLDNAAG